MVYQWFNEIVIPAIYAGIAGMVLNIVKQTIKQFGGPVNDILSSKLDKAKEELKASKIITENQNFIYLMNEAFKAWGQTEEYYRINDFIEDKTEEKKQMFKDILLKKVPGITEEEINELRNTIAGEFNKFKNNIKEDSKEIFNYSPSISNEATKIDSKEK